MSADGSGVHDEELPVPAPRRRRIVVAAAVVVGLALIGGVVARIADSSSRSSATPTSSLRRSPSPSSNSSRRQETAAPPGLSRALPSIPQLTKLTPAEISAAHEQCPRLAPGCQTTGVTPPSVLASIRTVFPDARRYVAVSDLVYTDENVPFLAYRRMTVRTARTVVSIEIALSQPGDGVGSQRLGTVLRCQNVANGLTVEVQAATSVTTADLQRLADDRRLTAID